MATNFHLREAPSDALPRVKQPPKARSIPVPFSYTPSDDGIDENLLILLHGLGDTQIPFAKLGRQFKLPQTATLALRAPEQIPFLYEQAFQWYPSFDPLGELISGPNPTPALDVLSIVLEHLLRDCAWSTQRIHIFGFAQGGSVTVEFAVKCWKEKLAGNKTSVGTNASGHDGRFGSIVTISGPLLSYPTLSQPCPTPVLVFHRTPPSESSMPGDAIAAFNKAFADLREVKRKGGEGMPSSKEEWEFVMKFWSETLGKRQIEGLYEVMSGTNS